MKRIAVYIRVSTKDQNPDLQINDLLSYCERRGWAGVCVCIYIEFNRTGTNADRPALKQLLSDVQQRKVDVVVTWKLDRLFRSLRHLTATLTDWQQLGVEFIALRDNIDLTTASGRLMMQIIGSFAEFEASLIRERTVAGMAAAKARGRLPGRKQPFTAEQLQGIRDLRSRGHSLRDIGRGLGVSDTTVMRAIKKASA